MSLCIFIKGLSCQHLWSELEPDIRRMLHHQTSFAVLQDNNCGGISPLLEVFVANPSEAHTLTRLLIQTLSNIATFNEDLMSALWDAYLPLPDDQLVFMCACRPWLSTCM